MKTTLIGNLPGVFCTSFENGNVLCYWKGDLKETLLHFFLSSPDNPNVEEGAVIILASLQFDFFVNDLKRAQILARESWGKFREQILAANGERLDTRVFAEKLNVSA